MCQGVIVSLVSFEVGKTRKYIVLTGVGSHSDLIKKNEARLVRNKWKANTDVVLSERIISIESNFAKGWNAYTVESIDPNVEERIILDRTYKRIAGNRKALIKHIKRVGKIDYSLVDLFTPRVQRRYGTTTNRFERKACIIYDKNLDRLQESIDNRKYGTRKYWQLRRKQDKLEKRLDAKIKANELRTWLQLARKDNNFVAHLRGS